MKTAAIKFSSGSLVTTTWEYLCAVLDPRQPTPLTARTHSMGLAYAATPPSVALPSALPPSLSLWHSPYLNQVLGTLPPSLSLSPYLHQVLGYPPSFLSLPPSLSLTLWYPPSIPLSLASTLPARSPLPSYKPLLWPSLPHLHTLPRFTFLPILSWLALLTHPVAPSSCQPWLPCLTVFNPANLGPVLHNLHLTNLIQRVYSWPCLFIASFSP
ncbi:hypothetical protein Pcinc_014291 [Petrolisthes cinctipes]|uniref:Uncharacterized protein n=1 Tax=Petrolisthes cinctipes TaxID=88211 RepID=A0AAE1FY32_PETCI|nr:hypothetical protein Pcinc_014291 [Petrolisthes cinctipes]